MKLIPNQPYIEGSNWEIFFFLKKPKTKNSNKKNED